jgi:ATP phosphoribosyltransferase regulatory subunit
MMSRAERWMLPDGVEELLPQQAAEVESLRRRLLDVYACWGYELVIPPLLEFTDSLLIGLGSDLDLQTFKLTDQMSGRTLGIRPDITPQTARMDAHSLNREGPVRLCYAGSVLHTRPKSLLASRCPIQVGAELYGEASVNADIEVICLMLETLSLAGVQGVRLDLGHVGIYRALVKAAELDDELEHALFDALQRKAVPELEALAERLPAASRDALLGLARLHGGDDVLDRARDLLAYAPKEVEIALAQLAEVAAGVRARQPNADIFFDLGELRGYHYHTGLVFAAYAPGFGRALANGGRYDDVGAVFGRARPATGFNTDLKTLLVGVAAPAIAGAIAAPIEDAEGLWEAVASLRAQGERVISVFPGQVDADGCDRELVFLDGLWQVRARN